MIGERKSLPETVGKLFDTAFALYGRRFGLYAMAAFGGLIVQAAGAAIFAGVFPQSAQFAIIILNVMVDALIAGIVTIGAMADIAGVEAADGDVFGAAARRFALLVAVNCLVTLVQMVLAPFYDGADLFTFGVLLPVVAVLSGTLGFATVICASDTSATGAMLFVRSIGQSFRVALAPGNIGRTALIGICVVPVVLLQIVAADQLQLRHVRGIAFWSNVPIDALTVGPLQAIFTVFYLDFVRRVEGAPRR